jgi:hypothetical protein
MEHSTAPQTFTQTATAQASQAAFYRPAPNSAPKSIVVSKSIIVWTAACIECLHLPHRHCHAGLLPRPASCRCAVLRALCTGSQASDCRRELMSAPSQSLSWRQEASSASTSRAAAAMLACCRARMPASWR